MVDFLKLVAKIEADASELMSALGKAGKHVDKFAKDAQKEFGDAAQSLDKFGKSAKDVSLKMGALGAAIAGPLALAGREAAKFGRGMADVASLGVENIGDLSDGLQALREDMGWATDGTKELYNAVSAGIAPAAALGVLEVAAKGARAGVGELGVALDAGTSLLNSYGENVGTTTEVIAAMERTQGRLATAVKHGKTTIDDLGKSVGRIAPIASQAGIPMDELLASIAALTTTGAPASEQVSGLKQVIASILKPTSDAAKVSEELGVEFNAAALESKGLVQFLRDIKGAMENAGYSTAEQTEAMTKLFASTEATNAVLGLTADQIGSKFDVAMADMANATDNLNAAFQASKDNDPSLVYNQVSASVKTLSQDVGAAVLTAFSPLAVKLTEIVQKTREWVEENPNLTASLVTVTGGASGLLVVLGGIGFALGGIAQGIAALLKLGAVFAIVGAFFADLTVAASGLGMAMSLMGISISSIAAPLALVVAGLALMLYNWRDVLTTMWMVAKGTYNALVSIFAGLVDTFGMILKTIGALFTSAWQVITLDFSGAIETWKQIGGEWYAMFAGWIDTLLGKLNDLWTTAKDVASFITGTLDDGSLKSERIPDQIRARANALRAAGKNDEAQALLAPYQPSPAAPNIPQMALGGIVTRPTFAMIGEAGPEAVIPLDKLGSVTNNNTTAPVTIQVYGGDANETAERVFDILNRRMATS